ncbi:MAG TPA: LptF/LptG family permease [Bacteroidales bacterium]|jgi:lipopolysaccharide export system permease protein|nr:YjgP/YjgQ family permease [Bacteroidales bacterium]HPE21987.1 LptF/LptG family permease [Bacteroidales bacterium]HRW26220.1 LptF/LptG family permease [Bacteroidales bacterium]
MEGKKSSGNIRESLRKLAPGILDWYIIRQFLGTFVFSLVLILGIAVIFDFSEKIDDFIQKQAPLKAIIFDYYLNFIPYFATLFAPMFVFISVIFFTSRMAVNTEIIAILNGGMSFRRLLLPYFISAAFIALCAFLLQNYVLPHSNIARLDFEEKYYRSSDFRRVNVSSVHRQVYPNVYIYMEQYNKISQSGRNFSMEKFNEKGMLESKMTANMIRWDSTANKWGAWWYYIRETDSLGERITSGRRIDTALNVGPDDFTRAPEFVHTMTHGELIDYIHVLKSQGSDEIKLYLNEKHRRYASPFAFFILTLIGVSLSSRKIKGGIGMQIGLGLMLTFSYILFMQFSSQFSLKGDLNPALAMWIPNIIYTFIAAGVYYTAPK